MLEIQPNGGKGRRSLAESEELYSLTTRHIYCGFVSRIRLSLLGYSHDLGCEADGLYAGLGIGDCGNVSLAQHSAVRRSERSQSPDRGLGQKGLVIRYQLSG